jgi:cytochrome c6
MLRTLLDVHPSAARGVALSTILLIAGMPLASNAGDSDAQARMELGRKIFTQTAAPQCGVCHTLSDAGTTGEIGAKLEELKPDAARVANAVRDGVGVMPSYRGKLTDEQIQAVAYYVSRATGGGKE